MNIIGNALLFAFEWFCRIGMACFWLFIAALYVIGAFVSEVLLFFVGSETHIPHRRPYRRK